MKVRRTKTEIEAAMSLINLLQPGTYHAIKESRIYGKRLYSGGLWIGSAIDNLPISFDVPIDRKCLIELLDKMPVVMLGHITYMGRTKFIEQ